MDLACVLDEYGSNDPSFYSFFIEYTKEAEKRCKIYLHDNIQNTKEIRIYLRQFIDFASIFDEFVNKVRSFRSSFTETSKSNNNKKIKICLHYNV